MIIIDWLIKYNIIISFKKSYNTEDLNLIILNQLIHDHKVSQEIISDRESLFAFKYWNILMRKLSIKLKLFTAFHSITDR